MFGVRRKIQWSLALAAIAGWCGAATAATIPQPDKTIRSNTADYSATLNPAGFEYATTATLAIGSVSSSSPKIDCAVLLFYVGDIPTGQTVTDATLSLQIVTGTTTMPTFNASLTGLGLRTTIQLTDTDIRSGDYTAGGEIIAPAALTKNKKYDANYKYVLDTTTVSNFNLAAYINEQLALRTSNDAYIALRFIPDTTPVAGQYYTIGAGEVGGITTNLNLYYGAIAVPESAPIAVLGAGAAALLLKRRR